MHRHVLSLFALSAVALAACGSDSDLTTSTPSSVPASTEGAGSSTSSPAGSAATVYPLTIDNCGVELTFDAPPERVLILNGTSVAEVQSFIALGLEDAILANSQSYGQSDIPGMVEKIAALPTGGLTLNENFEVPREQVLALKPDLVVSTWAGGFSEMMGSATREELASVGIQSWVTPVNCAFGADDPRPEDQERYDNQTYLESFEMLRELGVIFDVQDRAEAFIAEAQARIDAVVQPDGERKSVLLAYPGMSMMSNNDGVPRVFGGPFTDSLIDAAGGVNSFAGFESFAQSAEINAEALAAAKVDVLAVGVFLPDEKAELYRDDIFKLFPQWAAAQNDSWISIAETFYLGPYNYVGIEKLAEAIAAIE